MKKLFFTILVILLVLGAFLLGKNFDQKDLKENNEENEVTKEENNIAIPSYALSLLSNFDFSMNKSSITGFNDMDKYLFSKDKITKDDLSTEFKIYTAIQNTQPSEILEMNEFLYSYDENEIMMSLVTIFGNSNYQLKSYRHDDPYCGASDFEYDSKNKRILYDLTGCGGTGGGYSSSYEIIKYNETKEEITIDLLYYASKYEYVDENTTKITLYTTPDLTTEIATYNSNDDDKDNYRSKMNKYRFKFKYNNNRYYFESFEKLNK